MTEKINLLDRDPKHLNIDVVKVGSQKILSYSSPPPPIYLSLPPHYLFDSTQIRTLAQFLQCWTGN